MTTPRDETERELARGDALTTERPGITSPQHEPDSLQEAGTGRDATGSAAVTQPPAAVAAEHGRADAPLTGFAAVIRAMAVTDAARRATEPEPASANATAPAIPGATETTSRSTASIPESAANRPIARGDIRVVEPPPGLEGRRRLAVVRRVDGDRNVVEMMLAHPWPELATDTDAVISSNDSGLPFPLVVECYVRGPVWLLWQVRERVGFLPEPILQAIGAAVVDGQPDVEDALTGLPLAGPTDPRWRFKEDEVLEWGTLTDDCATALLEGDDPWQLEPERLHPHTYEAAIDAATPRREHLLLAETVHLLATRHVTVELQDLDPEALDPDRWVESLGRDRGRDAFAALRPTLDRTLSRSGAELRGKAA